MSLFSELIFVAALASGSAFSADLNAQSIYQVSSVWKNQNSQDVQLKSFLGQPVFIGMVYTGCQHSCPLVISKFQSIEKKIPAKLQKDVKFVLVSFDTKGDRPTQLKSFMTGRKLDESRWTFLSADKDTTVRELAVVLGISYKSLGDGEFSHSNVIALLNRDGAVVSRIESLSADVTPLIEKLSQSQ